MKDEILNIYKTFNGKKGLSIATVIATISLISAFMLEKYAGFKPCALCWTQRWIFFAFILASIPMLIKFPVSKTPKIACTALLGTISIFGIGVALRHIYVIFRPPAESCGFGPDMLFQMLPFQDAILEFLKGSPGCSDVDNILGLPIPFWSLMLFTLIGIISLVSIMKNGKNS